jgi:hypothetical protein
VRALVLSTLIATGGVAALRADELPPAALQIATLDRTIMVREARDGKHYGENEVDPLLWSDSNYFLGGESRRRLLIALKEVTNLADSEVRHCAPTQRALVQNRVWTVFDHVWNHATGAEPDRELLAALARAVSKLALDVPEIASIADPLVNAAASGRWPAAPTREGGADIFLPPDVVAARGGWVSLAREDEREPTAKNHVTAFGGRSLFLLRAKFPAGAPTPEAYFKAVADVVLPWTPDGRGGTHLSPEFGTQLSPELPPLPVGAEFALVRKLAVVGRDGRWHVTPLTLTIQLRRYRATDRATFEKLISADPDRGFKRMQSFAEFELETEAVGRGESGKMRAVTADEKRFMIFMAFDFDQVGGGSTQVPGFKTGPQDVPMQSCATCHTGLGLGSVNSLSFFTRETPLAHLAAPGEEREANSTSRWKEGRAEWGALKVFWPAVSRP